MTHSILLNFSNWSIYKILSQEHQGRQSEGENEGCITG